MRVVSNALNLNVSGTHHFSGEIDYSVQIALSELLSRRRRERRGNQEELSAIEDERRRVSLYVHVTGTAENPQFHYDFRNVFRNLELGSSRTATAVRQEREVVRTILRDEFQFLQKSEETRRQEELWREQEQGRFVIEWSDEEPETVVNTRQRNRRQASRDTVRIGVVFEDN
jgi:predicted metallo-beta-lactamase superfamily hydrolase